MSDSSRSFWQVSRLWGLLVIAAASGLVAAPALFGTPIVERNTAPEMNMNELEVGDVITVTGPLAVYGNEPHTYLALEMDDPSTKTGTRLVRIEGELLEALYELQGERVTVTGDVTRLEAGPGFPTVVNITDFSLEPEQ